MEFIADLHIHSHYSRATSIECCPEKLEWWARRKGIHLLGTGDFTHGAWRKELEEKLFPSENGFYRLKPQFRLNGDFWRSEVQFVVSGEISSIYKKNGRTRKVHNVILLPSLEDAGKLSLKLEAIGNLHSDGRPILGLDCKELLEITLEVCPEAIFIPAHIWTPHFSVLGANSGFDSIEECFEDLTDSIYAVETGLSSDPSMNMRLSSLDRFALLSNSDAHSPSNLGREANVFGVELTYETLYNALKNNDRNALLGTVEFFPEEGKYHFDGHRECNIRWEPSRTMAAGGICPVCGGKLTVGVMHRVEALADRPEGFNPEGGRPFMRMTTLMHIIAASLGCSDGSRRAAAIYDSMLDKLGPELTILRSVPVGDIKSSAGELVAEGIRRMRAGELRILPGYDGLYGSVEIFSDSERMEFLGQAALFGVPGVERRISGKQKGGKRNLKSRQTMQGRIEREIIRTDLNDEQLAAVKCGCRAILVLAGPGTGKTRTLVGRMAYLINELNVDPRDVTAVTFTNKAAAEMRERLEKTLPSGVVDALTIGTFHGVCMKRLRERVPGEAAFLLIDENSALTIVEELARGVSSLRSPSRILGDISRAKGSMRPVRQSLDEETLMVYLAYEEKLASIGAMDFDDLLLRALELPPCCDPSSHGSRSAVHILVDEFQDINEVQYALVRRWCGSSGNVFVIGDPQQAIYGFRGASPRFFDDFRRDFPDAVEISLDLNYRSTASIVEAANSVISRSSIRIGRPVIPASEIRPGSPVRLVKARNDFAEALFIAREINRLVGGVDMIEAHRIAGRSKGKSGEYGFSDIAVLYRTHRQADVIERCLVKEGIACRIAGKDEELNAPSAAAILSFIRFVLKPGDVFSLQRALHYCGETVDYVGMYSAGEQKIDNLLCLMKNEASQTMRRSGFIAAIDMLRNDVGNRPPCKIVEGLAEILGIAQEEPVKRLVHIAELHDDPHSFIDTLTFGSDADVVRRGKGPFRADSVLLSTLHAAKGLEFPVVFICGVNDGILPLRNVKESEACDIEEERRLFYVGLTRARRELILTAASCRSMFGRIERWEISPFVADMDRRNIIEETFHPEPAVEQMRLL